MKNHGLDYTQDMGLATAEVVSAAIMNTHVRDNLLETAPAKATAASQLFVSTAANTLAARTFSTDQVLTSQTTTSTSYTNLATTGPTLTATTGGNVLIAFAAQMSNGTAGGECYMDFEITGASSRSPLDSTALISTSGSSGTVYRSSVTHLITSGVTAGSNTFTAKYKVSAGTGTFHNRRMLILPL